MNKQNLGALEAWQIREFPRELRWAIVTPAEERRMSSRRACDLDPGKGQGCGLSSFAVPQDPANASGRLMTWLSWPRRRNDSADRLPKGLRAKLFRALRGAARAAIQPRAGHRRRSLDRRRL
jgi:hypothetical protein